LFDGADAERLRLRELGPRIDADDHVVGLLADARLHATAEGFDPALRFGSRHGLEGAGQHELLPRERPLRARDRGGPDAGLEQLLAEALDVHGTARAEEAELLLQLGGAGEPDAAVGHLTLGAHDLRAAYRAGRRHAEALLAARPPLGHDLHDVRDHVAGALEEDRVADADVLALDLVHVVE